MFSRGKFTLQNLDRGHLVCMYVFILIKLGKLNEIFPTSILETSLHIFSHEELVAYIYAAEKSCKGNVFIAFR